MDEDNSIFQYVKDEKLIDSHESLNLTNKRIVQWYGGLGSDYFTQIPLEKIDSISYKSEINWSIILTGLIVIIGTVMVEWLSDYSTGVAGFIVGSVIILLAFILKKPTLEIKSASEILSEDSTGINDFLQSLEEELYE